MCGIPFRNSARVTTATSPLLHLIENRQRQVLETYTCLDGGLIGGLCLRQLRHDLGDVGKIVLSAAAEKHMKEFSQQASDGRSLVEIEEKLLGCNHAEVGGRLFEKWKLPEQLIAAVRFHHTPTAAGKHVRLAATAYVGNLIAYFMGYGYGNHPLSQSGRNEVPNALQLPSDELPQYMEESFRRLKQVKSVYNLKG